MAPVKLINVISPIKAPIAIAPKLAIAIAAKKPTTPILIVIAIIGANGFNSTINLFIIWKPDLLFILANLPYHF